MKPRYAALTVLYCAGLFALSSSSDPGQMGPLFPGADKAAHAVLYAGLAAVVSLGIRRSGRPALPWVQFFVPIAFAFAYGVTDEVHQTFVPGRTGEVWDALANAAGATAIQVALCGFLWKLHRSRPHPPPT